MNIPNALSLLRGVLALFFFIQSPIVRVLLIVFAGITDFLDGYLARRYRQISRFGTMVDPLMDKVFVAVCLFWLFSEEKLGVWQLASFFLRDFSLILFSGWLFLTGSYGRWQIQSFVCGKITTAIQFGVLFWLAASLQVPELAFWTMTLFGVASFFELLFRLRLQSARLR